MKGLKKKLWLPILFLLAQQCFVHALFLANSASPELPVRNVDTGLDYATIQEGINAEETLSGHTIYVTAGVYRENLVINKSVSLVGQNRSNTIITVKEPRNLIYITVDNVKITGFSIRESAYGYSSIHLWGSENSTITNNNVSGSYYGIHLHNSTNNIIYNNLIADCEYGIRLYDSTNNNLSTNVITNNKNGVHLDVSRYNLISKNNISSNLWNGVYLYGSSENIISQNVLDSNEARGIRLHNSKDNTLSQNMISNNQQGLHLYHSIDNLISDNTISNNTDGIWLMDSNRNTIRANNISINRWYGMRLLNASYNTIFHNNFISNNLQNVEQPSNTSIANLWDNFFEGNYWSDQKGKDINKDGISDASYVADERTWLGIHSRDNHPLMGTFQHLNIRFQQHSYSIETISNSTIKEVQYNRDQENGETKLILNSINQQNTSFCRICLSHTLVEPPYAITIDGNPPMYNNTIRTNGTHTWIYLEYVNSEPTATIALVHKLTPIPQPPIWTQWPFWGILGLTTLAAILSVINAKYHRAVNRQKNLIRLYEEKLQKANSLVIARELFTADVVNRKSKIRKFEEKYGIKIRPRNSFEDLIKSIKTKQKESEKAREQKELN